MIHSEQQEGAVSPVIGVILMVAITVILAAVIAAFVFGMAGNVSKTKIVSFTVVKSAADSITITNMGGQDVGALSSVSVTGDVSGTIGTRVGATKSFAITSSTRRVIVTGTFTDGTTQVILDTTLQGAAATPV